MHHVVNKNYLKHTTD